MARGKKAHKARSYAGFRHARIAPRGRMSVRLRVGVYGVVAVIVVVAGGYLIRKFGH